MSRRLHWKRISARGYEYDGRIVPRRGYRGSDLVVFAGWLVLAGLIGGGLYALSIAR